MKKSPRFLTWFTLALTNACLAVSQSEGSQSWTHFLGKSQNNIVTDAPQLPVEWDAQKGVRWRAEIPGEGWSSPLVADGKIWMTTATDNGQSLRVVCVDFEKGGILHDTEIFHLEAAPVKHRRNSHASPTGILEGDRLYVHFGTHGTAALNTKTGKVLWKQQDLKLDHMNGPGGSLADYGDLLLVPCDGSDVQYEVALSKATGEIVWKTERSAKPFLQTIPADMRKAYGTPFVLKTDTGVLSFTTASTRLYALNPINGQEQWYLNYGKGFSNVPLPATDGKTLVICTGFMKPEVWAVKLEGASGDVSESHVLWKQKTAAPDQATPVISNGLVFTVSSGGIASCLDLQTGDVRWRERIGSDFAATPLVANGLVYFSDCQGNTTVVKAKAEFEVVAKNSLPEGQMASPAVIGNTLVVRSKAALYRIE
jgi:outer membrane protein assembly factor BamB